MNPNELPPERRCASTSNGHFGGYQGFKVRTGLACDGGCGGALRTIDQRQFAGSGEASLAI
jgi:hypothetical protein